MRRFGAVTEFWRVFTELNPDSIRNEAERAFRLVLLGVAGAGKTSLAAALTGDTARANVADVLIEMDLAPDSVLSALPRADLYVLVVDGERGVSSSDRAEIERLRHQGLHFLVVINKCDLIENLPELHYLTYVQLGDVPSDRIVFGSAIAERDVEETLGRALLRTLPLLRLALARRLPLLRRCVGNEIITETARVNAQFALLSNLPANIPVVGGLIGTSADFLVLTKNQALMVFKLAAIHGREMRFKTALAAEIAPVVGFAFLSRTLARELVGFLPSVVAAVPKTAIGYAGTYVVGRMAEYYYVTGRRPTKERLKLFAAEATERWRGIARRIGGNRAATPNGAARDRS